jgi:uncharacterized protein (TIGR03067 family)
MTPLLLGLALTLAAPAPKDTAKKDVPHVGSWTLESLTFAGQPVPLPDSEKKTITFTTDGKIVRDQAGKTEDGGTFTVDLKKFPCEIDVVEGAGPQKGQTAKGIFKVEGDTLTICMALGDESRPSVFDSPAGSRYILLTAKRVKKD